MKTKKERGSQPAGIQRIEATDRRATAAGLHQETGEWFSIEDALRVTRAQLQRLSAQHLTIQESERRRVAVDLHDGLGQTLSLAKLTIQEAARSIESGAIGNVKGVLERAVSQVKSAIEELRRVAMNLRPSTLDDLGIVATMTWYLREIEGAHPNVEVEPDISVDEADVPETLKISIFRIVQEATGNAIKHANANRIKVGLTSVGRFLNLCVEDNGRGFDPAHKTGNPDFTHGIGLQSMKERAELSGGSYEFQSSPGQGTRVQVRWLSGQESERQCPIVPINQASAQAMCKLAPDDDLVNRLSTCLQCVRSLHND